MNANRQQQLSEMRNPREQEINDAVVSSGETRNYERMRSEWTKMVEKLGEPFSIDDVTEIKLTQRQSCKELDRTRVFKEMIAYLYKKKYITEQEREQLNKNDVRIKPNDIQFKSNKSRALFAEVVERVRQEFSDNKLPEEFQDKEYIKGLFYRLNERKLLESMSFGFSMAVRDVNFFLKKVLNSKELDNDTPDEFLLSIVLQSKPAENISRYQQFTALKKYYAVMESGVVEEDLSEEDTDVSEMELFAGEQCTDKTINQNLRRILQKYDKRHMRINQVVKKFKDKDIPTYKYVICYLLDKIDFTDIEIDLEVLFQDIEQNKIGNTDAGSKNDLNQEDFPDNALDSKEAFQKLIQRVQKRFQNHELPDEFCKESYIEELILNLDVKKLLESMAFGLDMTVETVNLFLAKVLKRSELDYYDPKEYLLAIILNNSKYDDRLKYPQYISLKKYYEAMKVDLKKSVIEPENTRSILSKEDISFAENTELFNGRECTDESIHPKLKEMLTRHHMMRKKLRQAKDGRTFEFRTADEEFFELMEKTQKLYREDIRRFKAAQKETEERGESRLLLQRRAASGILRIQYKPGKKIELKKGTRFYRLKGEERIWFVLDEDVILPACERVQFALHVCSMTEKPENPKKEIFVKDKNLQVKDNIKGIISVKVGKKNKLRYYKVGAKEPDNGTIEIECKPGTAIAKGTRFTYTENDDVYEFESIEDKNISVQFTLRVRSMTEKPKNPKKEVFVKDKDLQVKDNIKGIISVKVGKKNKLHYYKVSEKEPDNGTIEIKCKPGTVIAKGTRFKYIENDDVYEFESIENMTADNYISRDVTVYCKYFVEGELITDIEQYENYLKYIGESTENGKCYILADTGTINNMEFPVEEITSVNNPKPIKFEPLRTMDEPESACQSQVSREEQDKFLPFKQYMYRAYGADYSEEIFDEIDGSLFEGWFTSTEITYETINKEEFSKKSSREKRNDLLTLIFLRYVKERDADDDYKTQFYKFRSQVNKTMQKCRLEWLHLVNPYDCLLAYLLAYDSPVDVLREIWAVVKKPEEKKQREA